MKKSGAPRASARPCRYCGTLTAASPYATSTRLARYSHSVGMNDLYPPMCVLVRRTRAAHRGISV